MNTKENRLQPGNDNLQQISKFSAYLGANSRKNTTDDHKQYTNVIKNCSTLKNCQIWSIS